MPNTLDFDVVFAELGRLGQTGNIAVLSAIIVMLLLYLLVVIFARKADKRDKAKVGCMVFFSVETLFQAVSKKLLYSHEIFPHQNHR